MSAQFRDIWPLTAELGGHNRILNFRMGGGTTTATEDTSWKAGEVLVVDAAAGDINPAGTGSGGAIDPVGGLHYIAASSSEALLQLGGGTSGASTHNILVPVFDLYDGSEFVTRNFYNNSDTNIGPGGNGALTGLFVGVSCDLWCDDSTSNHKFGLDLNGDYFIVTRLLDARGRDIGVSGGTCDRIVFKRNAG